MRIKDPGVLPSSSMYIHEPTAFAKDALFFVPYAGEYKCTKEYEVRRDMLDTFLFMFIESGEMSITYDGRTFSAKAPAMILLDCKRPHCYGACGDLYFKWFHFSGNSSQAYFNMLYEIYGCQFNPQVIPIARAQWVTIFEMMKTNTVWVDFE